MTYEELKAEANKMGYKLVIKGRPKPKTVNYNRCKECKYHNGEVSSVGIECTNPNRTFRTNIARFKANGTKACKLFERM